MSKLSLVIFDWDGTLMDSSTRIVASMQSAAKDSELETLEEQVIKNIIGLGLPEAILALYPDAKLSKRERLRERYSHHFLNTHTTPCPLFDGVENLLEQLSMQGISLAVATGKSRQGLNRVLEETGLAEYFASSRCADETKSKPDPAMAHEILRELDTSADAALVIGDTEFDLEMASRANIASIGVTYGSHSKEKLERHKPLYCVDESVHLFELIQSLAQSEKFNY